MVWFLVPRTANSFDYDPMRNQWIVADFNTANLQLGVLGSVDIWRESLIFQFIIQKHRFVRNHYIQWVEQILKSNVNRAYRSGREQRKKTL